MLFIITLITGIIGLFLISTTIGPYIALLIILLAFAYKIEILYEDISKIKNQLGFTKEKSDK